jgi:hypothetical protein
MPTRRFDPQAIPDFDRGGRLGELDPNSPEERQGSVLSTGGGPETTPVEPEGGPAAGGDQPASEAGRPQDAEGERRHPLPTDRRRR